MGAQRRGPDVVETHISTVFLVGDRAYKLKKAVRNAFLDWGTPERRREACRAEVALNRRLSPDVYLGVLDVVDEHGGLRDGLVVMRRMPRDRSLEAMVRAGESVDAAIVALAKLLAGFHARASRDGVAVAAGRPESVARLWAGNLEELRSLPAAAGAAELDAIARLAGGYQRGRAGLIARRAESGRSCDGHGDLLAADVFLTGDGPRVLDCLEFDPSLRAGDVLADVAFLAMDLERLGVPDAAAHFLRAYRDYAGDDWPASLADFWVAYRALVRAKVAWLRAPWDTAAPAEAAELLGLCRRHLEAAAVRLVLVGGAPGTGKTTIAAALAARAGWVHLATDDMRADAVGPAEGGAAGGGGVGFAQGRYRSELVSATYDLLLERAERCVRAGESVVLDATWSSAARRHAARDLARRAGAHTVEIRCVVGLDEALRRVRERAVGAERDEMTPGVVRDLTAAMEAWPTAHELETGGEADDTVEAAVRFACDAARLFAAGGAGDEGTFGPSWRP